MSIPFEAYQGEDPYIFVSYAHKDKDVVYDEIKKLNKEGYRIWYDEGIQPANEWPEEIAVAINKCSTFLVFISPQSVESKNVRNEINYALRKNKKFIAIYIKETTLQPGLELQMGSIQAIMKFQMPDDHYYSKLIKNLTPSTYQSTLVKILEKEDNLVVSGETKKTIDLTNKKREIRKKADRLILEGNRAFDIKDNFTGIEKFDKGIEKYKEIKDFDRVLDLLRIVVQKCFVNDHLVIADQFTRELCVVARKYHKIFYRGVAYWFTASLLLKKEDDLNLEEILKVFQTAAVDFEHVGDFAGAGMCYNKIGTIYHSRLNKIDNACLFYREAIESYNKAILKIHPLRTSFKDKPELLILKITKLRDKIDYLIPNLSTDQLKLSMSNTLRSIKYNF